MELIHKASLEEGVLSKRVLEEASEKASRGILCSRHDECTNYHHYTTHSLLQYLTFQLSSSEFTYLGIESPAASKYFRVAHRHSPCLLCALLNVHDNITHQMAIQE